jgi:hypothetical protein
MSLLPPVPIPSGQAIIWLRATTANAHPDDIGATNGSASYGVDPDTGLPDGSGVITMTSSGGLGNTHWTIDWSDFPAVGIPINASVTGIYFVVDGTRNDSLHGYSHCYGSVGGEMSPYPVPSDYSGQIVSVSLGTDPSIIPSLTLSAQVFDTISASFNTIFTINDSAIAVYYSAPVLPIGHGANCNDYDPIAIADGSVTAPGNGLLIS